MCGDALGFATEEGCLEGGFFESMRFKIACIFYRLYSTEINILLDEVCSFPVFKLSIH